MNITGDDRAVGIENFHAALGSPLTRAARMQETVDELLSSGQGLGPRYFGYGNEVSPVKIGIIGTGDEGGVLIGALNPNYVQVVAIADIRPYNIHRAFHGDKSKPDIFDIRCGLMRKYSWNTEDEARTHVKVYPGRYEELLDNSDVEAVIIALPLHLHAEASIKAMRKGKHVLCEKLMAHSVRECKEMARVAKETGKLLVIGHQRHYSVLYDNAVELVKQGLIGDIHHIRAQWHRLKDTWNVALPDKDKQVHDVASKKLEELRKKLANEEKAAKKSLDAARSTLEPKDRELLVSVEKDCAELPGVIAGLEQQIAKVTRGTPETTTQLKPLRAELLKQQRILAKATAERQKRLKPAAAIEKRLADVQREITKQEIVVQKYRDAELDAKVKDYGYEDRNKGGKVIPALAELIQWRLWDRTGGGLMAELGSHQLDAAGIFISALRQDGHKAYPLSVSGVGGRHLYEDDRDIDDHVYCSYEYPGPQYHAKKAPEKKIVVTYSSINGNSFGDYGETVIGTSGVLVLEREKDVMLFRGSNTAEYANVVDSGGKLVLEKSARDSEDAARGALGMPATPSKGYTEEIEHWAWSIRNPGKTPLPRCGPSVALADAVIALTTNKAIKEQKRIEFDPAWFDFEKDDTPERIAPDLSQARYKV